MQVVIGLPMITSAGNLRFWLDLAHALNSPTCRDLLQQFEAAEAVGTAELDKACEAWNVALIRRLHNEAPGVAGMHVMPINSKAKRLTAALLERGVLSGNKSGRDNA